MTRKIESLADQLNEHQLQLAMISDVLSHVVGELDGPDWMTAAVRMCHDRLSHLVESVPFPSSSDLVS